LACSSRWPVRDTKAHAALEASLRKDDDSAHDVFWQTTLRDRNLSSISQAGLVNNLNDGMAWGLFPLFFAAAHIRLGRIGVLTAIYPAVVGRPAARDRLALRQPRPQVAHRVRDVGPGSRHRRRHPLFELRGIRGCAALLGLGTAMVYPTLLAAIGDVAHPSWRASSVGVYRFWRDLGYAVGALLAGLAADALGLSGAMWLVAALTFASGLVAALRMSETHPQRSTPWPLPAR